DEAEVESSEPTTSTLLEAPVASIDQLTASAEPEAQADEDDSDVKSEPETGAALDLTSEPETYASTDPETEPGPAVSPEALQALTIAAASGSYKTLDSNSN